VIVRIKDRLFEATNQDPYWGWITGGSYDHEWKAYDAYLTPEHSFVDLGAWVGGHSMYASRVAKRIDAVEPDPVAYDIMTANLELLDPRPETHVYRCAVGKEGTVTLGSAVLGASTTRENLAAGGGIGAATETFVTQSVSLRKFCEGIPDPLFIKIDVEGSEEEMFKDAAFFAERKPTMLIELHPFWWKNEQRALGDFEAVKALYKVSFEIPHPNSRTWILTEPK
jgi:FkbM family methyltransferase